MCKYCEKNEPIEDIGGYDEIIIDGNIMEILDADLVWNINYCFICGKKL